MSEFNEIKIWNPEDIVNNASNWSLGADKELLKHLQHLSKKILSNAAKTNDNLVGLLDDLDNTSLSLDLANIELETLHHTQFIESRVYEDDDEFEAEDTKKATVEINKEVEEEKARQDIEEGILAAVKAVEEYYDYKEVPNSDSDDENDSPNYVWQPKDPYLTRPLPYVIGTTEWYRKWHVGLLEDSSDDEDVNPNDRDAENIKKDVESQSSDDERYLPQLDRRSTMALDGDNVNKQWRPSDIIDIDRKSAVHPIANSTLVSAGQFTDNNEEGNSLPTKEPNASFTEQLTKKLDNVAQARKSSATPEINTRPIQKAPPRTTDFGIFFDEPPPLNDNSESSDEDGIFGKPGLSKGGLFGKSETVLFDDLNENENESYWGQSNVKKQDKDTPNVPTISSNIFDNENESEDDLFASKPAQGKTKTNYIPQTGPTLPLFDDEPPPLPQEEKKKKPIGGVSIFGNTDIMKPGSLIKNLRKLSSSDSVESAPDIDVASSINKAVEQEKIVNINSNKNTSDIKKPENSSRISSDKYSIETKKIQPVNTTTKNVSLFDESDSLFEDDLFSNVSKTKFTSSLFDDNDDDINDSSSLFYTSHVPTIKKNDKNDLSKNTKEKTRLFEDLPVKTDSNKSNNQNNDNVDIFTTSSAIKSDLFDTKPSKSLFNAPSIDKSHEIGVPSKRLSLFEDINVKSSVTDSTTIINKPEPNKRTDLFVSSNKADNTEDKTPIPAKRRNLFDEDLTPAIVQNSLNLANNGKNNRKRLNLFDDFDEPTTLYNDITEKSLFDNEKVVKIDEDIKIIKSAIEPILTIPSKNLQFNEKNTQKLPETAVQSVLEPELPVKSDNEDLSSKLISLPLFDTPPEIEEDCDTDSEHNLFNDENHLLLEDNDSNDLFLPVHRVSIFDDEPPLLPNEYVENKTRSPPAKQSSPSGTTDNYESVSRNISVDDEVLVPQFHRNKLSIHERLNSVRSPVFDTDMDVTKAENEAEEDNNVFSDNVVTKNVENQQNQNLDHKSVETENLNSSQKMLEIPGKIKHNLNINVAALLPGASRKAEITQIQKTDDLDELDQATEILQCITKDRAKIPVKRRPSTRKARQETSSTIFDENIVVSEKIESNNNNNNKKQLPIEKLENSKSTESDLVNRNIEKTTQNLTASEEKPISKGAIKKTTSKKPTLFESSDSASDSDDIFKAKPSAVIKTKTSEESSDIFNGAKAQSLFDKQPVIKGDFFESPDYKKSKIFFDEDDDENVEDFFSSKKLPPKSNIMKKNLFDDEEEGDDLFQSTMKPTKISAPTKKSSKSMPLFPVTDATDDPLDLFK